MCRLSSLASGAKKREWTDLADAALTELSPTFDEMYSTVGRPSIPPERLLKSMVLIALYTVRRAGPGRIVAAVDQFVVTLTVNGFVMKGGVPTVVTATGGAEKGSIMR